MWAPFLTPCQVPFKFSGQQVTHEPSCPCLYPTDILQCVVRLWMDNPISTSMTEASGNRTFYWNLQGINPKNLVLIPDLTTQSSMLHPYLHPISHAGWPHKYTTHVQLKSEIFLLKDEHTRQKMNQVFYSDIKQRTLNQWVISLVILDIRLKKVFSMRSVQVHCCYLTCLLMSSLTQPALGFSSIW